MKAPSLLNSKSQVSSQHVYKKEDFVAIDFL